jgi:hypothetical protein
MRPKTKKSAKAKNAQNQKDAVRKIISRKRLKHLEGIHAKEIKQDPGKEKTKDLA